MGFLVTLHSARMKDRDIIYTHRIMAISRIICFAVFLLLSNGLSAQMTAKLDSLENLLRTTKQDSVKSKALHTIAQIYARSVSIPKGISYAEQGLAIAENIQFDRGMLANTSLLGRFYIFIGNYDSAEVFLQKRLDYAVHFDDSVQIAAGYADLARVFNSKDQDEKTIEYALKSLKMFELLKNDYERARVLNNLANYLADADGDQDQIIAYLMESLALKRQHKNVKSVSRTLNALGGLYIDYDRNLDSAMLFLKEAETINRSLGNKFGLSFSVYDLGRLHDRKKEYQQAEASYRESLGLSRELQDIEGIAISLEGLGNILAKQGQTQKGLNLLYESLDINHELAYDQNELNLLKSISRIESELGNHKKAYQFSKRFAELQDSLKTAESSKNIAEMQTRYETEKKSQAIALLTQENEIGKLTVQNQRTLNYTLIGFLVLVVILAFVSWNRYQLKLKTSRLLADKNQELETLNATKDKLFALVAHDLKNPLSAFRSITKSLNSNLDDIGKEELSYFLGELNHSADDLYNLLQNLLSWAISQIDQLPHHIEKVTLHQLIDDNFAAFKLQAKSKQLHLHNQVNEDLAIESDKSILATVLRNLIGNAIKFTPENGEIRIGAQQVAGKTVIEVHDEGIGLSAQDIEKLFNIEEDVTSIGTSEEKGTGLGLVLCKELLDKQASSIRVESELGKGSSFFVSIPQTSLAS